MRKEIDILLRAARRNCAVVEKDSNLLWTQEELAEAEESGQFQDNDRLLPPDGKAAVTSPYPGCMQMGSALSFESYRAVGQTGHFLIFAPEDASATEIQERAKGNQ